MNGAGARVRLLQIDYLWKSVKLGILPKDRFQSHVQSVGIIRNASVVLPNAFSITPPASSTASNIYFFQIRSQFFFFTLRAEHGHAVGDGGTGGDLLRPQLICDVPVAIADY